MKIGIDLRPLQGHNKYRGIGRHISSLLKEISKIDNANHYVIYIFKNHNNPLDEIDIDNKFNYKIKKVKFNYLSHKKYIGILFDEYYPVNVSGDNLDIFFQTDMQYGLPKNVRTLAIFYDLIPYYFWNKEKLKRHTGLRRVKMASADHLVRRRYLRVLGRYKKADYILAISKSSKRDLISHFKSINPRDVKVTLLGYEQSPASTTKINKKELCNKYGIDNDYILYVGGVDLRKNIVSLANIFINLKKTTNSDLKLVMAGKEFSNKAELHDLGWYDLVNRSEFKKDIVFTGYVDDSDLIALYKNAKAFVFPSLYEGFGLPVLEAMALGTPVIAFNNSSIPEVAGDAAVLCNNDQEFIKGIKKILDDHKFRQSLIQKGYKQVKKFSWKKTAKETLRAIEDLGRATD